jgi:hypothetical protein
MVIDTVGVKTDRPLAMLDMYGTPYTRALHVVERYRLLDYEAAREFRQCRQVYGAQERSTVRRAGRRSSATTPMESR